MTVKNAQHRGRSGPKPKPLNMLDPETPHAKYRRDKDVPTPTELYLDPDKPPELLQTDEAVDEWKKLARLLKDNSLLTVLDENACIALCNAWGDYVCWSQEVRDKGVFVSRAGKGDSIIDVKNPAIDLAERAFQRWYRLAIEFGMTPCSRTRITIPNKSDEEADFHKKYFENTVM